MASLNCRVYASSSEEQSSRDQRLRSAKLDEDDSGSSTTNLLEGERTQPRPAADGAAEVGGVPAVGPVGDAGGSTHWNSREKGGKNAALARDARAQPGSSDGSAPSRPSRENEQPNSSAAGPSVGIGAASAAGANDASSEEGRVEESNDGVQRKTPAELLAAGQEGAASNLRHEAVGFFRQFAMLPIDQWPVGVRRRLESRGNVVGPFVAALPETAQILELASAEGNDVAYFDSDAHELGHVCFAFANNFASDKNDEAVGEEGRLLWKNINGLVGEKCLRTQLDLLKNIAVEKYNVPGENADRLVPACTAFLNRTMVRGRYDLHSNLSTRNDYDELVANTDALTREVMRKLVQLFADGAGLVVCGDPSYEAVIGEAWLKGLGLLIPQTGPVAHPAKACMHWSPQQECVTAVDVCNTMMASALGRAKALITEEEAMKLMPWCIIEGGLAIAKKTANDNGERLWALLGCVHCGTTEGSLDSLSRPKKCNGRPGARCCRGRPASNNSKSSYAHKKWKVLKIIECLNCCKEKPWAMKELAEYGGCFCYACKPDHPANRKRKHLEERKEEKEERAAKKQRKAAEVAARAEVYRPLVIAAIESRAKQAGSAPTLEKIVRADVGEQFHRATFNSLLQKMVHDGELVQNKSTYSRAGVTAEERRAKEAAEKEEEKEERAKEKEAKKQRKAELKEQVVSGMPLANSDSTKAMEGPLAVEADSTKQPSADPNKCTKCHKRNRVPGGVNGRCQRCRKEEVQLERLAAAKALVERSASASSTSSTGSALLVANVPFLGETGGAAKPSAKPKPGRTSEGSSNNSSKASGEAPQKKRGRPKKAAAAAPVPSPMADSNVAKAASARADTEKYDTEEFCLLGCTYFFVSSEDHESGKSTLDQCLDQCDSKYSWNAPHPPYNDLVAVARLECRDGCLMALQRCQPGYFCLQVTFDGEDATSYTGGDMIPCPAGTYRDVSYEAVIECVFCPPNYFREDVKGRSLTSCSPCPAGTSAVDPGSDSIKDCVRCPAGTFSSDASFCSCITPQACAEDQLPPPANAEKKDTVPFIGRW